MRLKNEEIRHKLMKRTLTEFLTHLKEQELTDYYNWAMNVVQHNNGVRYETVTDTGSVSTMYEKFIEETTSIIDKEYNKKRKILRMLEGTQQQVGRLIEEEWDYFVSNGLTLDKKQVKIALWYLYTIFYYDTKAIENVRKRYQNLAFVLMVLNECQKEELEYIVLYVLEHGGTLLNTVFEGRKNHGIDR